MSPETWEADWERVLWKRKSYPDNFVPRSFLSSLSKNPNFRPYTYAYMVVASCAISQHLATIFTFVGVFVHLKERSLDARILVWISIGGFIAGNLVWELCDCCVVDKQSRHANRSKTAKSSILVFLALLSLSPVLKTLTAATSSDSIWALSSSLFILNALLADYTSVSFHGHHRERLTSVLSMNAAISSSVVLASRLPDDLSVFALVLFAVQLFALFPMLRRRLQGGPAALNISLTVFLCVSSVYLTVALSTLVAYIYVILFLFVTFGAPGMFVWAQKYKNEIRGTWDPAIPRVKPLSH